MLEILLVSASLPSLPSSNHFFHPSHQFGWLSQHPESAEAETAEKLRVKDSPWLNHFIQQRGEEVTGSKVSPEQNNTEVTAGQADKM